MTLRAAQERAPEQTEASTSPTSAPGSVWDTFVAASTPGSYLQLSGWAAVKAVNGWSSVRVDERAPSGARIGAQILLRRPRPRLRFPPGAFSVS